MGTQRARGHRKGRIEPPQDYWDVFISYAWEDKPLARPLAEALRDAGLKVWYDDFSLKVGDSLRRSIDFGLSRAKRGIVILSPAFFRKAWPQRELDALVARESGKESIILPVWHQLTPDDVAEYSLLLLDRVATMTSRGLDTVIQDLLRALGVTQDFTRSSGPNDNLRAARTFYAASQVLTSKLETSGNILFDQFCREEAFVLEIESVSALSPKERIELQEVLDLIRLALITAMPLALTEAAIMGVLAEAVRTVAPDQAEDIGIEGSGVERLRRNVYDHTLGVLQQSQAHCPHAEPFWELLATLIASYVEAAVRDPTTLPDELPTAALEMINKYSGAFARKLADRDSPLGGYSHELRGLLHQWRTSNKPPVFTTVLAALVARPEGLR
ncbi:MAG TPA: toll/interleukin-1 receptor domain-containing protein [Thermoanaerobaculia bacterium]|nr:toll/interleukin-1 receptor domain-containing protein [Thermoanaerobaculia bacterium]